MPSRLPSSSSNAINDSSGTSNGALIPHFACGFKAKPRIIVFMPKIPGVEVRGQTPELPMLLIMTFRSVRVTPTSQMI